MAGLAVILRGAKSVILPTFEIVSDACFCEVGCDYFEYAFAGTPSGNGYKKDKSSFLYAKVAVADTIKIFIEKAGVRLTEITNSNFGYYNGGFAGKPNYTGFVADWTLIHAAFGSGKYTIVADLNVVGNTYTLTSRTFKLMPFNSTIADGTFKIELFDTGTVLSRQLDYSGLLPNGWYSSYRLQGSFGDMNAEYTADKFYNSANQLMQNRETIVKSYTAQIKMLPISLVNKYTEDLLANTILISSYKLNADFNYNAHSVVLNGIAAPTYLPNGRATYNVTFKDFNENTIKRNAF